MDWRCQADAAEDLFAPEAPAPQRPATASPRCARCASPDFLHLCEQLILHRDPARFALMLPPAVAHGPGGANQRRAARPAGRRPHDPPHGPPCGGHPQMHAFMPLSARGGSRMATLHMAWSRSLTTAITVKPIAGFSSAASRRFGPSSQPGFSVTLGQTATTTSPGAQLVTPPPGLSRGPVVDLLPPIFQPRAAPAGHDDNARALLASSLPDLHITEDGADRLA